MEKQYYTPKIEEFCVGFECQVYYPREKVWKDRKIRHGEDLCEIVSRFTINNKYIRVKKCI